MSERLSDAEALMALVKDGSAHRTKIGRLRGVLREIEDLQRSGLSNLAIVGKLNELGYDLTLKTFETMLYRIRKEGGSAKRGIVEAPKSLQAITSTEETPNSYKEEGKKAETEEEISVAGKLQKIVNNEMRDAKFDSYAKKKQSPLKKS